MASKSENMRRVDHQKLISFVSSAFAKLGVPKGDAEIAAQGLVAADLRGVDTHGVIRFNPTSWYVKWLRDGEMNPAPNIHVVSESAIVGAARRRPRHRYGYRPAGNGASHSQGE